MPFLLDYVHIRRHGRPQTCVDRFLLPELSYSVRSVPHAVIVHKDRLVNGWLLKWQRHRDYLVIHVSLTYSLTKFTLRQLLRRHRTLLYPTCSSYEIQCFYTAIIKCGHLRGAIKIDFRLTNGLLSNYEYSDGDW